MLYAGGAAREIVMRQTLVQRRDTWRQTFVQKVVDGVGPKVGKEHTWKNVGLARVRVCVYADMLCVLAFARLFRVREHSLTGI